MIRIDIKSKSDFEKFKGIKKDETVFLKIDRSFQDVTMKAVDLSGFKGIINIEFEDVKAFKKYHITSSKECFTFFEGIKKHQVQMKNKQVAFYYREKKEYCDVYNENDFYKAIKHNRVAITLKQNIVFENNIPEIRKKVKINGNNKIVFVKKRIQYEKFSNTYFVKANKIISINKIEDFEKLSSLNQGIVIVNIKNDMENFEIKAISLEHFTGTMIILGNKHKLSNGTILNENEMTNGLISVVHPYANIYIKDLKLERMTYRGESLYAGGFIGSRKKSLYCSSYGSIVLDGCSIVSSLFFDISLYAGIFLGNIGEEIKFSNCTFSVVKQDKDLLKEGDAIGYHQSLDIRYDNLEYPEQVLQLCKKV